MRRFLIITALCVITDGCSNPFSSEDGPPPLPDTWFITQDGITVMSEYADEMLVRLNVDTDSLGNMIDTWNRKVQNILHDSLGYDQQYLSSPDLGVLFASQDYINQWHDKDVTARGIYIRVEKTAGVSVWWELDAFDQYNGDDMKGLLWVSGWILVHELVHYYQERAGKGFSECEANAVREYFFYGMLLHPDCTEGLGKSSTR
ncbi:hypothetical protein MYX06_02180 [Patescibacteria group bacterium AH-259-L05]|nr:hypothetical protein [Patescibacteria group bacterium AH-259-L05]